MWIVKLALKKPYTFVVVSLLVLIFGIGFILRMPKDIFPNIDIPVISLIWTYNGLPAEDFEQRITTFSEFALSNYVNDIDRIESQTIDGLGLIRVYFHPEAEIEAAVAQATATSQAILRRMPPGVLPPVILRYSASSVPIVQLALSSQTMDEAELYDYSMYRIRQAIATIRGTTIPTPLGGKVRQIMVDIEPKALQAKGLSPRDVNHAVNHFNLTLPTGNAKIGATDYRLNMNMSPDLVASINDFPIKVIDDVVVYLRDVAFAHDGFLDQTNIVRNQGERSVLLTLLKNGAVSTLNIINDLKNMLPTLQAAAPEGMKIHLLFDQSVFVKAAIQGVVLEGTLAALLTGLMMLLFLGSWRSTLIVIVSIPLSLFTSIIFLALMGETLNIMTLGGLALSIGILVDNATVTIENIHRQLETGKSLHFAILDGSNQVAVPAFVSTLAICVVFLPVALLVGPSKFLFTPFAYAVVFAISASYFFSRTVVPVLIKYLLACEVHQHANTSNGTAVKEIPQGILQRFFLNFDSQFNRFRTGYENVLEWCLHFKRPVYLIFALIFASAFVVFPFIGRNFFPSVDADLIRLHVKAPTGTRLEVTEEIFGRVEHEIKQVIPHEEIALLIDNIGLPSEPSSLAFGDNATVGTSDGEILISLHPKRTFSTQEYMKKLRSHLKAHFPDLLFYFQPADMINQILNFGLPTPIDIKVAGHNKKENIAIAQELVERISHVPGAVDVHLHQVLDEPELYLDVDRTLLAQKGINHHDVVNDLLLTYSTSSQVHPNFWLDRNSGIPYLVAVQYPKYHVHSTEQLMRMPVGSPLTKESPLLDNLATIERRTGVGVASHLNIEPVLDIYANIQERDLGGVSSDIRQIIDEFQSQMKPGNRILLKGSVENMDIAFSYLGGGFLLAVILIYFILVINFQSWLDPFIIIMAIPGALAGICWLLFLTQTTLSVPALMGTIMCVGVATANSILIVTFANQQMKHGKPGFEAIHIACKTRLRPVLMTALAMIVGMIPMALGLGEGGEQNAPLGRAVIGGLFLATFTTLFFVPVLFAALRVKANPHLEHEESAEELPKKT